MNINEIIIATLKALGMYFSFMALIFIILVLAFIIYYTYFFKASPNGNTPKSDIKMLTQILKEEFENNFLIRSLDKHPKIVVFFLIFFGALITMTIFMQAIYHISH